MMLYGKGAVWWNDSLGLDLVNKHLSSWVWAETLAWGGTLWSQTKVYKYFNSKQTG